MTKTSFTYELDGEKQAALLKVMREGNYKPRKVPYAIESIEGDHFNATLYEKEKHGARKLCVQGSKAAEFVEFVLEPLVLGAASLGYEDVVDPESVQPHAGSDESGKGDYFGPLVVCAAYIDPSIAGRMREMGVRDCKAMTDKAVLETGEALRRLLGESGYALLVLRPSAYNRLYAKMKNINRMLAWAHATAIEELLAKKPGCGRVVVDQFAPTERTILSALKPLGRAAEIVQRHKAESDLAVAAASVIAREKFLRSIREADPSGSPLPAGSSDPRVAETAVEKVRACGPVWLMNNAKAHFSITDRVLAKCGLTRDDLPPEGRVVSSMARKLQAGGNNALHPKEGDTNEC